MGESYMKKIMQIKSHTLKTLSLIMVICLLLSACGKSTGGDSTVNNSYNMNNETNSDLLSNREEKVSLNAETTNKTEIPLNITLDSNGFVPLNSDGVVKLEKYSETATYDYPCVKGYTEEEKENPFKLVYKHVDEVIPKISKASTIGIYDEKDEIKLIPLSETTPKYTVPLNFYDNPGPYVDEERVNDFPKCILHFNVGHFNSDSPLIAAHGTKKLEECNGQDLKTFINSRSNRFHTYGVYGDEYKIIDANKNEKFTFGGYCNTSWEEFTVKPLMEYYEVYTSVITIPVEKTKKGYFQVDFSNIETGLYFVVEYNSYIELV